MSDMFTDCVMLHEVKLGSSFSFKGDGSASGVLQTPSYTSTGKWMREDGAFGPYTPAELRDNYDGAVMAGTWIWEPLPNGGAVAVLDDEGTMTFFRTNIIYVNKSTGIFADTNGHEYSGRVFTGFENGNRTWESYWNQIKTAHVAAGYTIKPNSMKAWFSGCSVMTSVDLSGVDSTELTSIASLFNGCAQLKSVNLSGLDTSNVTSMYQVFNGCSSLSSLDLSNFDVSNVTDFYEMFRDCSSLTTLNLTSFSFKYDARLEGFFTGCSALSTLILGTSFNFSSTPGYTFSNKEATPPTPPADITTQKWIRDDGAYGPFTAKEFARGYRGATMAGTWIWQRAECPDDGWAYAVLDEEGTLTFFRSREYSDKAEGTLTDVKGEQHTGRIFSGFETTTKVPWSVWKASILKVCVADDQTIRPISFADWFSSCANLTEVDLEGMDSSQVTSLANMFKSCGKLTSLDMSVLDLSSATNMNSLIEYVQRDEYERHVL